MANKFRTAYSGQKRITMPTGDGWEDNYQYDSSGMLKKDALRTHTYAIIQSHAEECDIKRIMERVINGDMTALSAKGEYMDITGAPTSLMEIQNMIVNATTEWENLQDEVKERFESLEEFLSTAGEEEWLKKMGIQKIKEVNENEPEHGSTLSPVTASENPAVKI